MLRAFIIAAAVAATAPALADCTTYEAKHRETASWLSGPQGMTGDTGCRMLSDLLALSSTCKLPPAVLTDLTTAQKKWCGYAKRGLLYRDQFYVD